MIKASAIIKDRLKEILSTGRATKKEIRLMASELDKHYNTSRSSFNEYVIKRFCDFELSCRFKIPDDAYQREEIIKIIGEPNETDLDDNKQLKDAFERFVHAVAIGHNSANTLASNLDPSIKFYQFHDGTDKEKMEIGMLLLRRDFHSSHKYEL